MFPVDARRSFTALLVVLLISGAVAPAFLTAGTGSSQPGIAAGATPGGEGLVPAAVTPTDNDSVRHENPDEAGENGDLGSVKGWLLGRIGERLGDSTANISQGQYDAAEGLLGEETRELLGKYVDVAGDTESEDDDETAERINDTIEEQRNFTRSRRNFSELYQEYLDAVENGNLERARRLARELADLERRLNRTGRNITRNYRELENRTGIDTGEERRIVNRTVQNVSEIQEEIREDLFNETRIVIEEYTENASVLDPIIVRGRVVVENGTANTTTTANETPVPVGDVVLGRVGTRVTVNETGHFTLRHRPVLLPREETTLGLEYRPPETSAYLGSTAEFTTTIEGREPTLEINGTPEAVRFGDRIDIEARLTVGNRSIAGVPIEATLGGAPLGSAVSANGTTTLSGVVPAAADDGQRELRVALPFSGRALMSANATRTVQINETETRLTTNVTAPSATQVRVQGQLETVNGTPLPQRTVRVAIGGVPAGNATTNVTGAFALNLTIPEGLNVSTFEDRRVPVNATFVEPGTNLGTASAERLVTIPLESTTSPNTPADDGGLFGLGVPWLAWAAFAVLALWMAGAYVVLRRREDRPLADIGGYGVDRPSGGPAASESATVADEQESDSSPSLLAIATERLEAGAADTATEAGYEAVRRRFGERLGVVSGTHWELYRACQTAGWPDDRVAAVRRLTEAYEQAAFAPGSLSSDTAREAIATARDLLDESDAPSGSD